MHPDLLHRHLGQLAPSATVSINERSNLLRAGGREVLKLGLGQSPFPVPHRVVEALRQNAHEKDYLPVQGLPELRASVARHADRTLGAADRTAADVMIGPGSKELMFLLQLVCDADLILPAPSWVSYAPQAQLLGRRVRPVETSLDGGWMITPEALDQACTTDRPALVLLNYPSNPTGQTFNARQLEGLAAVARRNGALVLSDEIYGELHHDGAHRSIAEWYPEGTLVSSGLSKWCGAGGWRLGTFVFPKPLHRLRDAMVTAASETFTSVSAPIQYAAVGAFDGGPEIDAYLAQSRRILASLGTWAAEQLRHAGAIVPTPTGGFYLLPTFEPLREQLESRGVGTAQALAERLLEETNVATLPGHHFLRPENELTLRLAYVDFDGAAALKAASEQPDGTLDEAFLERYCGNVVKAVNRICEWMSR